MSGLEKLLQWTRQKEVLKIKDSLMKQPSTIKGPLFECYLEELFKGNGWLTKRNGGSNDKGADLLLYHPDSPGEVVMIVQAKNQNRPLSFDDARTELRKFEEIASVAFKCSEYMIVSVSGFTEKKTNLLKEFKMKLKAWSYIEELIDRYNPEENVVPDIELFSHNELAFERIEEIWRTEDRAAIAHATGTGKSYIIYKCLSKFRNQNKLVLAPTNEIIDQLKNKFGWLHHKTTYMTYSKLANLSIDEMNRLNISLLVLDEFHRVGAEVWGRGVEKLLACFPNIKVLGTTATHIRYLDGNRDMGEELFGNNIVSILSLAEAIAREIIPMPLYISALYTIDGEIDRMKEKIEEAENNGEEKKAFLKRLNMLKSNWEHSKGIPIILQKHTKESDRKFIVFCSNKEHLYEMEWVVEKWFKKARAGMRIKKYRVLSGEKNNKAELKDFREATDVNSIHLLFAVDMLNEGIHIKDVSGVILLRSTISPIIYFQQIGRAIQTGKQEQPIIFDFVNNSTHIKHKDFKDELEEAINQENGKRLQIEMKPKLTINVLALNFIDETEDVMNLLENIENELQHYWKKRFEELVQYKQQTGDCLVPRHYENKALVRWVDRQRQSYKKGELATDKIEKLNKLGFDWDPIETAWNQNYETLGQYSQQTGDCLVPRHYENKALVRWVDRQRQSYKKGELATDKIEKLNKLGFDWDPFETFWNQMYEKIERYSQQTGDCLVPRSYEDNALANWVANQRQDYKKGKLAPDKIEKLNKLGFDWDPFETFWNQNYEMLSQYSQRTGDCLVSRHYEDKALVNWVDRQRQVYKNGKLAPDKIVKLNKLGFDWDPNEAFWNQNYKTLGQYSQQTGDCLVPKSYENKTLVYWVLNQRQAYKNGKLAPDKIEKLNKLGFDWDPIETAWNQNYEMLSQYSQRTGDCLVPRHYEDEALVSWVLNQRQAYKNGKLAPDKIEKLNKLGFEWKVNNSIKYIQE